MTLNWCGALAIRVPRLQSVIGEVDTGILILWIFGVGIFLMKTTAALNVSGYPSSAVQ